jgi:hypothetical protein
MTWMTATIAGALAIAAASTLGDFIWATWIPRHRPVFGMTHGTLLFLAIGLYLGVLAKRPLPGAIGGTILGFTAAGTFYVLAPMGGYSIMFLVWMGTWFGLSALHVRLQRMHGSWRTILLRGVFAAIAFTGAFYAVSGIWFPFDPTGWDYAWHFGGWTVAYLGGFAPLFIANSMPGAVSTP